LELGSELLHKMEGGFEIGKRVQYGLVSIRGRLFLTPVPATKAKKVKLRRRL